MSETTRPCGDCGVQPGQPHVDGCDVARCTLCGWQRISCEHEDEEGGWGQVWTGRWPGDAEVEALGLTDLNELASLSRSGLLRWDREAQRWTRP